MPRRSIEPGRRYRELRRGGRSAGDEWIVEEVKTDRLGLRHARLVSAVDLTRRKTLSVPTLADPPRFEEVEEGAVRLNLVIAERALRLDENSAHGSHEPIGRIR